MNSEILDQLQLGCVLEEDEEIAELTKQSEAKAKKKPARGVDLRTADV